MKNLKEMALNARRMVEEYEKANEDEAHARRRIEAGELFVDSFGFAPDKVVDNGICYSGDLVLMYVRPEHFKRFCLQVTCEDCGELCWSVDFHPSLEELGRQIECQTPQYTHFIHECKGDEPDLPPVQTWEDKLIQAIKQAIYEAQPEY